MLVYFTLNDVPYYYVRNGQNDIVGILDNDGNEVVRYKYDTWGKLLEIGGSLANTVGRKNPYRYRGYRYDNESGLYYLQSRYYNPEIGRFINADSIVAGIGGEILGNNLFAYCFNNPVNMVDENGNWPKWIGKALKVTAAVAAVAAVTTAVVVTAGAAAVALGASATVVSGVMTGAAVGGAVSGTVNIGLQVVTKGIDNISISEIAKSTSVGAITGAVSGGIGAMAPATSTSTQLLVQKGLQVAANVIISDAAYLMSTSNPTAEGFFAATFSGIASGATFNVPAFQSLAITVGLEMVLNTEEAIKTLAKKHANAN